MRKLLSILAATHALTLFIPLAALAAKSSPFPNWSQQINTTKRFTVLAAFGGAAVLDNETGLVWEQAPVATLLDWSDAIHRCYSLELGGRKGWRPPSIEELTSLVDMSQPAPKLPPGHPFSGVQSNIYWSVTSRADDTSRALDLDFSNGGVASIDGKAGNEFNVWCVRGAQGSDGL